MLTIEEQKPLTGITDGMNKADKCAGGSQVTLTSRSALSVTRRGLRSVSDLLGGMATAGQPESADDVSQGGAARRTALSKAAKHHWYSERSPWTEQWLKDDFSFKELQPRPKAVILDRQNPPQSRSTRTVESEN